MKILLLICIVLLTGCETTVRCKTDSPTMFPVSGMGVGDQLFLNCPPDKCPAVWEWVSRLSTYKQQLEVVPVNKTQIRVDIAPESTEPKP